MDKNQGSLYIVSTPIGNLNDITFRAIEVLNSVDVCAAEDTRVSGVLFKKYGIQTKLVSFHKFSEKGKTDGLINLLKSGKDVALISDAGTPLISDPGEYLVEKAIENGISLVPIPGVTSVISALTVSGFDLENFTFFGFFPRKLKERKKILKTISSSRFPSVLFESGKRLEKLFDFMSEALEAKSRVLVAREITKLHETFYRGTVDNIKEIVLGAEFGNKGEFVIVIEGSKVEESNTPYNESHLLEVLMKKLDRKLALELASEILNKKRNYLYQLKLKD